MADLLDRVPATIPGLVQPGTWLANTNEKAVVVSLEGPGLAYVAMRTDHKHPAKHVQWFGYTLRSWSVDLTDRTSRVHAAWWAFSVEPAISGPETDLLYKAEAGLDMTPEQIDTLARLVLRLAREEGHDV